jgi:hypothetical protein
MGAINLPWIHRKSTSPEVGKSPEWSMPAWRVMFWW